MKPWWERYPWQVMLRKRSKYPKVLEITPNLKMLRESVKRERKAHTVKIQSQ